MPNDETVSLAIAKTTAYMPSTATTGKLVSSGTWAELDAIVGNKPRLSASDPTKNI
jgi:hypothetical protein